MLGFKETESEQICLQLRWLFKHLLRLTMYKTVIQITFILTLSQPAKCLENACIFNTVPQQCRMHVKNLNFAIQTEQLPYIFLKVS